MNNEHNIQTIIAYLDKENLEIVGVCSSIDNALDEADKINNEHIKEYAIEHGLPNSISEWRKYHDFNSSYGVSVVEDLIAILSPESCEKLYEAINIIQNGESNISIKIKYSW
jgi:methionyl-tRNA formyltransferase